MTAMPIELAIAILIAAGWGALCILFFWSVANMDENRLAYWIIRTLVWIGGLGIGYLVAWAAWSIIVGGAL